MLEGRGRWGGAGPSARAPGRGAGRRGRTQSDCRRGPLPAVGHKNLDLEASRVPFRAAQPWRPRATPGVRLGTSGPGPQDALRSRVRHSRRPQRKAGRPRPPAAPTEGCYLSSGRDGGRRQPVRKVRGRVALARCRPRLSRQSAGSEGGAETGPGRGNPRTRTPG